MDTITEKAILALEHMAELINTDSRWTQGSWARDGEGKAVPSRSEDAVCWCLYGAHNRVLDTELKGHTSKVPERVRYALRTVLSTQYQEPVDPMMWNDMEGRKRLEVVGVIDKAIMLLKGT